MPYQQGHSAKTRFWGMWEVVTGWNYKMRCAKNIFGGEGEISLACEGFPNTFLDKIVWHPWQNWGGGTCSPGPIGHGTSAYQYPGLGSLFFGGFFWNITEKLWWLWQIEIELQSCELAGVGDSMEIHILNQSHLLVPQETCVRFDFELTKFQPNKLMLFYNISPSM